MRATGSGGEAVLERYTAHLGIPVHDPRSDVYPMWDGQRLRRPDGAEDWAHELAHWLLAGPDRRQYVNYGWGQDFEFAGYDPADPEPYGYGPRPDLDRLPWAPADDAPDTHEEILASLLGFAFLVRVGCHAPYDVYGFYVYERECQGWEVVDRRRISRDTYLDRREVQPWVAAFDRWRASP